MAEKVIQVEGLGKRYVLNHVHREKYTALRDVIAQNVKGIFGKKNSVSQQSDFWALQDVNFTINRGDRVGIIGRNGAGKSTLLKILSRIVDPTQGKITIDGRISSLLEVGTGFHPELSGRENIFLNGAILGMNRKEIQSKFDEIVAFAEVERFLDTPVKRYSSGMYVRLAFAVAAHLEPEILIVDEVLAVGDAEFQRKCLGKMKEVAQGGRTILFVSHNMAAIQNLCDTAIYLRQGQVVEQGPTSQVISTYLKSSETALRVNLADRKDRQGNGSVRFTEFFLTDSGNREVTAAQSGSEVKFNFRFETKTSLKDFHLAIGIDDEFGQRITHLSNEVTNQLFVFDKDHGIVSICLPKVALRNGSYSFTLYSTANGELADYIQDAGRFYVESGDFYGTGKLPPEGQGNFFMDHHFSIGS